MNTFGTKFRISIFGESHGQGLGVVIDGVPAGLPIGIADFEADLSRRRSGAKGTTPRKESDLPELVSGEFNGYTTGAPLTVLFRNENTLSGDYSHLVKHPRPSHADRVAKIKYNGYNDYRGGGHFSGRVTLGLVAAGVVAKKILARYGIRISASIKELGGITDPSRWDSVIEDAVKGLDSIGGIIECRAAGVPAGWGEPFFDSVESVLSHLFFSVPAVKGVEFGRGFASAALRGSENNDPIISADGKTLTNNAGGINGGIANGNDFMALFEVNPTPCLSSPQHTWNEETGSVETLVVRGRHDACIALRAPVVIEAAMAIGLAQFSI
ncbi:MAG: chorismate synthase [Rikenellaceae bacterium]|nr:chorismate synthase [Rikenellaceae bacterium]